VVTGEEGSFETKNDRGSACAWNALHVRDGERIEAAIS
jgi:hypothetical protein